MQATEAIIKQTRHNEPGDLMNLLSIPVGLAARLFKCWHTDMSRPFTRGPETYRACLDCGARRKFNLADWKMQGPYYFSSPGVAQSGTA